MKLEEIFDENLINLRQRIDTIGNKYPNLIKAFSFKKNDPHIEKMIGSFALISASLEYEIAKKMSKEIRSIFINVFPEEFCPIPPIGIISIAPHYGNHFKIKKQSTLVDNKNLFIAKRDFYINDIVIKSIEKTFFKNQLGLNIVFEGSKLNQIENIDLMVDINTLNCIFKSENMVTGILKNRDIYETEFTINLHNNFSLRDFCIFPEQFYFIRLSDFKIQTGVSNSIEIFIPLQNNLNINNVNIKPNCAVIENRFLIKSAPFQLKGNQPTIVPLEPNTDIINISNLFTEKGEKISHINEVENGWHLLMNKESIEIYVNDDNFNNVVFVEIECYNKSINLEYPFFEEYIPGSVKWDLIPIDAYKYIYQNEVAKLIQMMYLDKHSIDNVLKTISELLLVYNNILKIQFENVEIIESIKPVKLINYVLPKIYSTVSSNTNTTNFILLRHIVEEIRRRLHIEIDFLFNTPEGEVYYE